MIAATFFYGPTYSLLFFGTLFKIFPCSILSCCRLSPMVRMGQDFFWFSITQAHITLDPLSLLFPHLWIKNTVAFSWDDERRVGKNVTWTEAVEEEVCLCVCASTFSGPNVLSFVEAPLTENFTSDIESVDVQKCPLNRPSFSSMYYIKHASLSMHIFLKINFHLKLSTSAFSKKNPTWMLTADDVAQWRFAMCIFVGCALIWLCEFSK